MGPPSVLLLATLAMAVGREGVLSTSVSRDVRCGRRLVSGLFSRPRLPLGYSHIATVPPGACKLNVSELVPSENYIALKLTNGSYIMNGEFAVSSPGTYEAAGAQFVYRRGAGVETIYTHGPTMQSIDVMILYQHPNPSIKYEYLTDTLPGEPTAMDSAPEVAPSSAPNTHHHHRHHTNDAAIKSNETPKDAPQRKFVWWISSFNQCSRSCGGGIQIGKYRCVEEPNGKEVSTVHCAGTAPVARRRRCNLTPCPPRWRATSWTSCPACGPAAQTRNVGCVQDNSRGMTKISDAKCTSPMPATSQACDIADCGSSAVPARGQDARRQALGRTEPFRGAARPALTRPHNRTTSPHSLDAGNEISAALGPEYFSAAGGWLYTEWSECVGWCVGGGVRSRGVRCADPAGCPAARAPLAHQPCSPKGVCEPHTTHWFTGEWSGCSAACGGRQVRAVLCLGGAGRRARDAACAEARPPSERACADRCRPDWFLSDWSACTGPCGGGVQTRTVTCARADAGAAREGDCPGTRPPVRRACDPPLCAPRDASPARHPPDTPRAHHHPTQTSAPPTTTQDPQRIARNQNHHPRTNAIDSQDNYVSTEGCTDRLVKCSLAAQARLCASPYYSRYCCRSCSSTKV